MELDVEDSHLCIRCNQTIIGLQNYVNHRQSNCGAQAKSSTKHFTPNFSIFDTHTNKKIQSYDDFTFGDEREEEEEYLNDDDEESEEDFVDLDADIDEAQNNKSTKSEFKEYDYDFFSSLELQCMSTKRKENPQDRRKNFNHRIMTRKATAAVMAQNGDEWIDDSNVVVVRRNKKDERYEKFYQNESNESSDSEDSEPTVPRNYTRGKWRPGSRILNNFNTKWKSEDIEDITKVPTTWDLQENESSNDANNLDKSLENDYLNPPPNHTKGKWVPGAKISRLEFKDEKIDEKSERDSFWCRYCSRNLATRAIYERHLKSNLHKKRTKQQNELEGAGESLPLGNLNELSTHFTVSTHRKIEGGKIKGTQSMSVVQTQKNNSTQAREADENTEIIEIESEIHDRATSTPINTRPVHVNDDDVEMNVSSSSSDSTCSTNVSAQDKICVDKMEKCKKFRSRTKITCEECDMKLPVHLFGNHLISHFHYRKMLLNPKKSYDTVLNNFHKIAIQSPFQCQPCKFYFNNSSQFMRHWNSIEHVDVVNKLVGGKFLCSSFCKFECVSNAEMTSHLDSSEHQQVVTLINRSKPIIIRYIRRLFCMQCQQEFRYNIQLMQHLRTCKFKSIDKFKFNDTFDCDMCEKAFQSALSLQKHKIKAHGIFIFFCSECKLTFQTALEAKTHRRTNQHKAMARRKKSLQDPIAREKMKKVCPFCDDVLMDIIELKQHIRDAHPERNFRYEK
jgi:hypothetical protein